MGKLRVAIVGAGNISNTRHIPALMANRDLFEITGVVSDEEKKIKRTLTTYQMISNSLTVDGRADFEEALKRCGWFGRVDAVVIGTPPKQHYLTVRACLRLGKHVLVEKPMMMDVCQCEEVKKIASERNLVLYVMHSFQFSKGMNKLYRLYRDGELGELQSVLELQLSNRERRLPKWYQELPLGLFYDEAAHFFYGARRFGGGLKVLNAHARYHKQDDSTPRFLEVQLQAGKIPVQMYMNFNSPICEWGLILIGNKKIAVYDYFKDILIVLGNDGKHYAGDVLRTSAGFFTQFWGGFFRSGFQMVRGKLLYGHDECIRRFGRAILNNEMCFELSADLGLEVVRAMNEVVRQVETERGSIFQNQK